MNIPLNIDWQQIFLHLFNFAILAMGLYLLLYKPVKDFMDKRTAFYQQLDEETKAKLAKAEEIKAGYDRKLKCIDEELNEREVVAQEAIKQIKEKEIQQAKEQADKIISDARKEAKREHDRIINDAQKEVTDMVTEATEKVLFQSSTSESFNQFLATVERGVQSE